MPFFLFCQFLRHFINFSLECQWKQIKFLTIPRGFLGGQRHGSSGPDKDHSSQPRQRQQEPAARCGCIVRSYCTREKAIRGVRVRKPRRIIRRGGVRRRASNIYRARAGSTGPSTLFTSQWNLQNQTNPINLIDFVRTSCCACASLFSLHLLKHVFLRK